MMSSTSRAPRVLLAIAAVAMLGACARQALVSQVKVPASKAQVPYERAAALDKNKKPAEALAAFIEAVEADPDFLAAHDRLVEFRSDWNVAANKQKKLKPEVDAIEKSIDAKYKEWEQRFPDSNGILYGIAAQLQGQELPGARSYLLKCLARDPNNAKVYDMLAIDAVFFGDDKAAAQYIHKASMLEPKNAEYAFLYASVVDASRREAVTLDAIDRFPASESAAAALYSLGDAPNDARHIEILERRRTQFPPEKFPSSNYGMPGLFEAYLRVDPAKAVKLAQEMQGRKESKEWADRLTLAQTYIEVNQQVATGNTSEAVALLDKLKAEPYSSNATMLARLRARVMAGARQLKGASESLLQRQANSPDDEIYAMLRSTGKQLNKAASKIDADLKAKLNDGAKVAASFDLQQYGSDDTVSLAKLRGKVVLLTFWFPGCGPCRQEFPHFETVMREFRNKDVACVSINGIREQDDYVLPLMASHKHSFIALKGTDAVTGPKGYKAGGYPDNFVIDRTGRMVYSSFMIDDARGELMVQRMIESIL